ncbi:hypothetical protein AGMMS49940_02700 [Spirochaetia bacterium]|nr:hypothetical protein AGMMS49940_02700 [Spirochaetia bacterium]
MQETLISIPVEPSLKEKVEALARVERRNLEEETTYLVENGLRAFEGWGVGMLIFSDNE